MAYNAAYDHHFIIKLLAKEFDGKKERNLKKNLIMVKQLPTN